MLFRSERDIFAKDNEINIINTAIIDFASVNQRWEDELAEIEKEESNISRLSEGLNREIAELKEQIATLEEDVSAETLNLETQKENLEKQNEEVTRERISLGSLDSEKSRVEAIIKRVEDSIEAYERDKQVKSEELLSFSKEREEIKDVTAKNTEIIEEKEKQIQELNSKLNEYLQRAKVCQLLFYKLWLHLKIYPQKAHRQILLLKYHLQKLLN